VVVGEMPEGVDMPSSWRSGGYTAALASARLGRKVVLVDADGPAGLGGVCVNAAAYPPRH